jgi:hypothetical protein
MGSFGMTRAANIIRPEFTDMGSTSAYPALRSSPSISSLPVQPPALLPAQQDSDADRLSISSEGRDAQARLDLGNLIEQLKQQKVGALTSEQQQLIGKYEAANQEFRTNAGSVPNDSKTAQQKNRPLDRAAALPVQFYPQDDRVAAQTEALAIRATAELLRMTNPTKLLDSGSASQNVSYSPQTESNAPMWIDVFA